MTIRVNGQVVPEAAVQYELMRLVKFYSQHLPAEQLRRQMPELRARAREQAVGAKLLIDHAAMLDIKVPKRDVDARIDEMVANAGGREAFEAMMVQQGLTWDALRESITRGRRVDLLVEQIGAEAREPSEEDLQRHFEAHADEYRRPDRVQAQHILVTCERQRDGAREKARRKLSAIRRRLAKGADFSEEAAAHSECPSGRSSGGSLGWFSRGMMVKEFDDVVFAMAVGALSDVIETPLGLHLIRKLDHETGGPASFEDVRGNIRDFLRHARRGEAVKAYVEELKQKAAIEGL